MLLVFKYFRYYVNIQWLYVNDVTYLNSFFLFSIFRYLKWNVNIQCLCAGRININFIFRYMSGMSAHMYELYLSILDEC